MRTNADGHFEKALGNIKRFVGAGIPVSLSFVIMKPNINEITQFVKLARELGVKRVSFGTVVPLGAGKNVNRWFLAQEEYKKTEAEVNLLRKQFSDMEIVFNGANEAKGELCSAGVSKVAVLPNGDVYSCGLFMDIPRFKLGNISGRLDKEKLKDMFIQESVNSKNYWEKCVACKISINDNYGSKTI